MSKLYLLEFWNCWCDFKLQDSDGTAIDSTGGDSSPNTTPRMAVRIDDLSGIRGSSRCFGHAQLRAMPPQTMISARGWSSWCDLFELRYSDGTAIDPMGGDSSPKYNSQMAVRPDDPSGIHG